MKVCFLVCYIRRLALDAAGIVVNGTVNVSPAGICIVCTVSVIISFPTATVETGVVSGAQDGRNGCEPCVLSVTLPAYLLIVNVIVILCRGVRDRGVGTLVILNVSNSTGTYLGWERDPGDIPTWDVTGWAPLRLALCFFLWGECSVGRRFQYTGRYKVYLVGFRRRDF